MNLKSRKINKYSTVTSHLQGKISTLSMNIELQGSDRMEVKDELTVGDCQIKNSE
jgi:hypothetical protein